MKPIQKLAYLLALLFLLTAGYATPAYAFEDRVGDNVVVAADEVIDDDLYVMAETFTLDGTVNGDVVVFAKTVWINGTVNGDLITGAQTVVVSGTVSDDARVGAAAIQLTDSGNIGSDLVAGAASLEAQPGSLIAGELASGTGQALLAGEIAGDVLAGSGGLELQGTFGGDVTAYVEDEGDSGPPPTAFLSDVPITLPRIEPGLTIADGAEIAGNLDYTTNTEASIPAGAVGGQVTRHTPVPEDDHGSVEQRTNAELVTDWAIDLGRAAVSLILVGLFLAWLFPRLMRALPDKVQVQPLQSLGWGILTWAGAFFMMMVIVLVTVLAAIFFGILTLGGLSGTIVWLGIFLLLALITGFSLAIGYVSKIVVGKAVGEKLLRLANSPLAEHRIWPLVIGVLAIVLLIGLLSFPLVPLGLLGALVNCVVIFAGLGALWLWGREAWAARRAAP